MKPKVLYVVHQWIDIFNLDNKSVGDTSLHLLDIIDSFKDKAECYILFPSVNDYILARYSGDSEKFFILNTSLKNRLFNCYDVDYRKMIEHVIDDLNIDFIHIHHLMGHCYDIVDVIKERKIPTIVTLHDYFLVCPNVNFLYQNKTYCDVDTKRCVTCLNNSVDTKVRNKKVAELLDYSRLNIVPNITVADNYKRVHKNLNYKVIEHGIDLDIVKQDIKPHKKFNVAFVGVMAYLKGSEVAKEIIKSMNKKKYNFYFFGVSGEKFFNKRKRNYRFCGEYKREEIGNLLMKKNIDLVCLPTICPETYCYTFSEVLNAKIPIIGFDIGAIGNRIKENGCGWTVSLRDGASGIIDKINYISSNEKEYSKVLKRTKKCSVNTKDNMLKEINEVYINILDNLKLKNAKNMEEINTPYTELKIKRRKKTLIYKMYKSVKKHIPYSIRKTLADLRKGLRNNEKK